MKPISLTIKGLHSFRQEQNIDFTAISDVGIFGIFGPTGSGKSTVLDAITLALYGRVERSDANRVGIINQQEDKVYVKFIFALALAKTSLIYTVERVYSRIDEQRLKSTLARLILNQNGNEIVIADKEKEVTKEIESILGLTVDDFTRAVVLPQGKFAEFLTLKAADRRPMLERLFRLDQYGRRLKDKAQSKENNLKKERDEILARMEVLAHATKENLDIFKNEMDESKSIVENNEKEYSTFIIDYNQKQKDWDNKKKLNEVNNLLLDLNNNEDINIKNIRQKENAEKAKLIKSTLDLYNKLDEDKNNINNKISDFKKYKDQLLQETLEKKEKLDDYKKYAQKQTAYLTEKKIMLQEAIEWEKQIDDHEKEILSLNNDLEEINSNSTLKANEYENEFEILTSTKNEINNLKKVIENNTISNTERKKVNDAWELFRDQRRIQDEVGRMKIELEEYETKIRDMNTKINNELEKIDYNKNIYSTLEEQIKKMNDNKTIDLGDWYNKEKLLSELIINVNVLEDNLNYVENLKNERKQYSEKVKVLENSIKDIKQQIIEKENFIKENKSELVYIEEKDNENSARKLADKLEKGKPCMVCGSTIHPSPNKSLYSQDIEEKLNTINNIVVKEELELANLIQELRGLENNLNIINAQLSKTNSDLDKYQILLEEKYLKLPKEFKDLTINQIHNITKEEKIKLDDSKNELNNWISQYEKVQGESKEVKENIDIYTYEYKLLTSQVGNVLVEKEKTDSHINRLIEEMEKNEIKLSLINKAWDYNQVELLKKHIDETGEKQEEIQMKLKNLEEISFQKESIIKKIEIQLLEYKNKSGQMKISLDNINESKTKLRKKLIDITEELSTSEAINKVNVLLEQISKELIKHEDEWNLKNNEFIKIENNINSEQAVLDNVLEQYNSTYEKLDKFIKDENWEDIKTIEQNLMLEKDYEILSQEIKKFSDRKNFLVEQKRELSINLDGCNMLEEEWASLKEKKFILEENLEKNKVKSSEITFQYYQLEKEHEKLVKYDLERKEIQHELDIASELNQVLRGNSFVDFIAQEYLHNITIIASDKLRLLTRNRYSLGVDELGVFQLIDELNGSLSRPVQSLSGGETFLASLALALALSSQIQLKGEYPLEFFFLDEGFGSLDSDLLDTVMMTLEKLNSENLMIGIISHLPELQSRVNRRFIVEPPDSKGNGSMVKLEFA